MNPVRKRLKLSPPSSSSTNGTGPLSQHAFLEQEDGEEEEEDGFLLVEEEAADSSLIITMEGSGLREVKKRAVKRKRHRREEDEAEVGQASASWMEEVEIDTQLDQSLESKSKQHNLTTVNVRNIIHEVITNEHVVAMMKAAINETEAVPAFEPKMTRSKLKEVVEKGVVIPAWNISPIKKSNDANKPPQFVDIPLAEEDSSDEEYCPDEEDEDETAEDTFQESDMESTASSPRGSRLPRGEEDSCSPWQTAGRRHRKLRSPSVSMGPPPPPPRPRPLTDSTFMEKLHAVEEELAVCMEPYQPLSESEDEAGLMAYRTRSKRPLRDVPLGQLEAELQAPDITPDMYDSSSAPEDREWTDWLRSLMSSDMDNEEEGDDEDDPEYNFLADVDEPDVEDYRDDKAVRITKKEVNQLMEELFETLKEDLVGQELEEEGHEEEEEHHAESQHKEQQQHMDVAGAEEEGPITELRTVKQQLDWIRKRGHTHIRTHTHSPAEHTLTLSPRQRRRLEQQLQQHVQLLTQVHLLTSPVSGLQSEAEMTRHFLVELDFLSHRVALLPSPGAPGFQSSFRTSNLQGALQLLEELRICPLSCQSKPRPPDARGYMRVHPLLPPQLAWIFSTRPVFLHPELLPTVSLDPALYCPRRTAAFTAAEDCLLVLGLRNMEGSPDPAKLISHFLLRKTVVQVRRRILQCCRPGVSDNMVKAFRFQRVLWQMPLACRPVDPADQRPPVEREEGVMPMWLVRSLPIIYPTIQQYNVASGLPPVAPPPGPRQIHHTFLGSTQASYSFPPGTRYPPRLPKHLHFRRLGFVVLQEPLPSALSDPTTQRSGNDIIRNTNPSNLATSEQILAHHPTLTGLRMSRRDWVLSSHGRAGVMRSHEEVPTPPPATNEEEESACSKPEVEEEEESEVLLALSESSSSVSLDDNLTDDDEEVETESEEEVEGIQEESPSGGAEDDDDQSESEAFALDYLKRVCEAVQDCPGVQDQVLQVLDQFSTCEHPQGAEHLYHRLCDLLQPWPQLLKDFAAFLNPEQALRCGLLMEQQVFERSRRFLRQLNEKLGENSALHQQVVMMLQDGPALPPADMDKISSLLQHHSELQQLFLQLRDTDTLTSISHNPPHIKKRRRRRRRLACQTADGNARREAVEAEEPNMIQSWQMEEVLVWTREEDRLILKACQQSGANENTFTEVSTHMTNRSTQQVCQRFHDLMSLFQKSTSCPQ